MQMIFVYGSLKQGFRLHHFLSDQRFCGIAETKPLYRLFDLGSYPGLVDWPQGRSISGELYEVDATAIKRLDEAEGVADGLYARRRVELDDAWDQPDCQAWFWLNPVIGLRDCGQSWP